MPNSNAMPWFVWLALFQCRSLKILIQRSSPLQLKPISTTSTSTRLMYYTEYQPVTLRKNPPPVVIRFKTKFACNNFVYQKKKIKLKSHLEVVENNLTFILPILLPPITGSCLPMPKK